MLAERHDPAGPENLCKKYCLFERPRGGWGLGRGVGAGGRVGGERLCQ